VAERLTVALLGADPRARQQADGLWGLVPAAVGSPLIEDCAFAVVDVETTGMRAGAGDRVIEVAVVVVQGVRRDRVVDTLVNPGRPVPRPVVEVTRITDGELRGAPSFAEVADQVRGALSGRVFVAHNVRFDWAFLASELNQARGVALAGPRLCTARLARRLVRGAESCGLDWLTQYFDLQNPARHRAGGDAWATAQLLERLLGLARQEGARTLQDLESFQRRRSRPRRKKRRTLQDAPVPGS
jgi:DNA polymerase-3 subunit epsilon